MYHPKTGEIKQTQTSVGSSRYVHLLEMGFIAVAKIGGWNVHVRGLHPILDKEAIALNKEFNENRSKVHPRHDNVQSE